MPSISNLFQEHKIRLRNYIAKRVQGSNDVDDILQEVFLRAHRNLHTVKSPGNISAWLFRVAANAIADHYRGNTTTAELPDELPAPEAERNYVLNPYLHDGA